MSRRRRSGACAPPAETGPPASCAAAGTGGLVAEIVRRHWPDYLALMAGRGLEVPSEQTAAAQDIRDCRTAALGAQMLACPSCGHRQVVYHSCHHRLCPQCGGRQASAWLSRQRARQLHTPYFLVTFTVPRPLRALMRRHARVCMELMFEHSAGALQDSAAARKHLDGELGLISVLHTWRRDLGFHPHIHVLLPGVGLDTQKGRCTLPKKYDYLAPVARLSACWRARMEEALRVHLPQEHARFPTALWRKGWVTHVQPAGTGTEALMYLAPTTCDPGAKHRSPPAASLRISLCAMSASMPTIPSTRVTAATRPRSPAASIRPATAIFKHSSRSLTSRQHSFPAAPRSGRVTGPVLSPQTTTGAKAKRKRPKPTDLLPGSFPRRARTTLAPRR